MRNNTSDNNFDGLLRQLYSNLECPINWEENKNMLPVIDILYEKWFIEISRNLPDSNEARLYLRGFDGQYMGRPGEGAFMWDALLRHDESAFYESSLFLSNVIYSHEVSVDSYRRDCERLLGVCAQDSIDRKKHYPTGVTNCASIRDLSLKKRDIGFLIPTLTPKVQELAFWASVSYLFQMDMGIDCDFVFEDPADHRNRFDMAWGRFLGSDKSFRITANAMGVVGYYNGLEATNLVFDVSLHAKQIHCYPSVDRIDGLPEAVIDDLQGVSALFDQGKAFPL